MAFFCPRSRVAHVIATRKGHAGFAPPRACRVRHCAAAPDAAHWPHATIEAAVILSERLRLEDPRAQSHPVSLASCQPLGRSRKVRSRSNAPLENRLRLRERGGHPSPPSRTDWRNQPTKSRIRPHALRRSTCDDLAAPSPFELAGGVSDSQPFRSADLQIGVMALLDGTDAHLEMVATNALPSHVQIHIGDSSCIRPPKPGPHRVRGTGTSLGRASIKSQGRIRRRRGCGICGKPGGFSKGLRETRSVFRRPGRFHSLADHAAAIRSCSRRSRCDAIRISLSYRASVVISL